MPLTRALSLSFGFAWYQFVGRTKATGTQVARATVQEAKPPYIPKATPPEIGPNGHRALGREKYGRHVMALAQIRQGSKARLDEPAQRSSGREALNMNLSP